MKELLEALTFLVSTIGACILVSTCGFWLCRLFKYLDKTTKDTNKQLIKATIKEVSKNEQELDKRGIK